MANHFVLAHGGRGGGTATGTCLVPRTMTVCFFVRDGQDLSKDATRVLVPLLIRNPPFENVVRSYVAETRSGYETVPNYTLAGDNTFTINDRNFATGLYWIGQGPDSQPVLPIPSGNSRRLSEIIGGIGDQAGGGAIGNVLYVLACRVTPVDTNSRVVRTAATFINLPSRRRGDPPGKVLLASNESAPDMGLTPSAVKARGGLWL